MKHILKKYFQFLSVGYEAKCDGESLDFDFPYVKIIDDELIVVDGTLDLNHMAD